MLSIFASIYFKLNSKQLKNTFKKGEKTDQAEERKTRNLNSLKE